MDREIQVMLESIDIDENAKRPNELRKILLRATAANAQGIVERIDNELGNWQTGGQKSSENEPYYLLFYACAYEILEEHEIARTRANFAASAFQRWSTEKLGWLNFQRAKWNEAMTHWFLAIVYRNENLIGKAEDELKMAVRKLDQLSDESSQKRKSLLSDRCQAQIEILRAAISGQPGYGTRIPFIDPSAVSHTTLATFVRQLDIPGKDVYFEWLRNVQILRPDDLEPIREQIDFAISILRLQRIPEPSIFPLGHIFLAHCYMLYYLAGDVKSLSYAIRYAEDAISIFHDQGADLNEALSKWYLALIYYKISNPQEGLPLAYEAISTVESMLENSSSQKVSNALDEILHDIRTLMFPAESQDSAPAEQSASANPTRKSVNDILSRSWFQSRRTSAPQRQTTSSRKYGFNIDQVYLPNIANKKPAKENPSRQKESSATSKGPGLRRHIIIPVDVRTLQDLNADSDALDANLFANLQEYQSRMRPDSAQPGPGVDPSPAPPPERSPRIPSFPIYGQVAAGPAGEPNLDSESLTRADMVYDDLCIDFDGKAYRVLFLENQEYNFVRSRRYGWLKVIGESMNNCAPIKINHGNYVLFAENRNVESCISKIVVAVLRDSQPPQLVVKELLKLSTKRSLTTDGFGNEYSALVLHSESISKIDPKTGKPYQDIPITEDHQLVGQVIAVASPK